MVGTLEVVGRLPLDGYRQRLSRTKSRLLMMTLALSLVAFGALLAIFGQEDPRPFALPAVPLVLVAFWIMPEIARPPVRAIGKLVMAMIFVLMLWPPYLALVLPGLPWISPIRTLGVPLLMLLLFASFGSRAFRAKMVEFLRADRPIMWLMLATILISVASAGYSVYPGLTILRLFIAAMAWFGLFYASVYSFAVKPDRALRLCNYMVWGAVISVAIGLYEVKYDMLPWRDHVPWFLDVGEEYRAVLEGQARAATGLYRVQAQFFSSIGLGEFLGLAMPFVMHKFANTKSFFVRAGIVALLPLTFIVVLHTDSRSAFICFAASLILSTALQAILFLLHRDRRSLTAQLILLAYPAMLVAFIVLSLLWVRLTRMVWGGGAAQASTDSRAEMFLIGIPKILAAPWGHGLGTGAITLGYYQPGSGLLTIDSYLLSIGLELGVIGFLTYFGMFIWAGARGALITFKSNDDIVLLLAPASIAIFNFLTSKLVYSQQENHPLVFLILGMMVALIYRHNTNLRDA